MCILLFTAIDRFFNCMDTSYSKCLNTLINDERNFFCARNYAHLKDENHGGYGCAQKGWSAVQCQGSTLPKEAAV